MPRAARPWFRFYVEACADRKLRRLKPEVRWLFVCCLAAARNSCRPGELLVGEEPMDVDDLADFAGMPQRQVCAGTEALIAAGLVSPWPWSIPRWNDRQFESDDVTERTRRHRSKERSNVVRGNGPDTDTDTDNPPSPPSRGERRGAVPDVGDLDLVVENPAPMPEHLRRKAAN